MPGEDQRRESSPVERLERERKLVLQAYYDGAVDLDHLKTEQDGIPTNTALARAAEASQAATDRLAAIFDFAERMGRIYRRSPSRMRRQLNQALFTTIKIGRTGTALPQLRSGFEVLLIQEEDRRRHTNTCRSDTEGAPRQSAASKSRGLGFEYRASGRPPGTRTRHLGIKSPLL